MANGLETDAIFSGFPVIVTKNLVLREISCADENDLFVLFSDPEVMRFYDVEPLTASEQARFYINRFTEGYRHKMSIRWGITQKGNNTIIGTCGFYNWSKKARRAETGYELLRTYWNKGIMSEALAAMIKFGLAQMNLQRIEAYVEPENLRSRKVLSKIGFQDEELLEEFAFYKGSYHRFLMFSFET